LFLESREEARLYLGRLISFEKRMFKELKLVLEREAGSTSFKPSFPTTPIRPANNADRIEYKSQFIVAP